MYKHNAQNTSNNNSQLRNMGKGICQPYSPAALYYFFILLLSTFVFLIVYLLFFIIITPRMYMSRFQVPCHVVIFPFFSCSFFVWFCFCFLAPRQSFYDKRVHIVNCNVENALLTSHWQTAGPMLRDRRRGIRPQSQHRTRNSIDTL